MIRSFSPCLARRSSSVAFQNRSSHSSRTKFSTMAQQAEFLIYGKGDPVNNVKGDCPFCHRVYLYAESKGVKYDLEYIDFANKPQWLLEVNPEGTVPIIKVGEQYIPDSGKICEYLEEKYPEPSMKATKSEGLGNTFFGAFRGFLLAKDEEAKEKEAALLEELKTLNDFLASNGPFFGGDSLDATDCSLAPKMYHMKTTLSHFKNWEIPDQFPAIQQYCWAVD
eukprot:TRINITY_DN897_c2_g1_i1.p1 TRINITY_DN897_c2_g1~~TRINITY_DN897_c2_g1_i1.p1  ORF type:complete len:223 (-),score=28.27 TRINITY_DN897_c2_g1_i1:50-718(-)